MMHVKEEIAVDLRPWSEGDLDLLQRLMGDPEMMEYLGGVESPERIRLRHERYLRSEELGEGPMFVILAGEDRIPVGMIGYWEHDDDGQHVWETGWSVLKQYQGQGIATRAELLVAERARATGKYRYLHAFSSIDNGPSNAVCRKAGFELQGELDMEYPKGTFTRFNDWRLDLFKDALE